MFIGHLPAGYIVTRQALRGRPPADGTARRLMALGLVAAVLPDTDLAYFYLIDSRQTLHHEYWTHLPVFWAAVAMPSLALAAVLRRPAVLLAWLVFHANIFLHLALDTVVGHVLWLYPLSADTVVLFDVPARHDWWVWNFVLHWTFVFELLVCGCALALFLRARRRRAASSPILAGEAPP
jgi:inner membrane protein